MKEKWNKNQVIEPSNIGKTVNIERFADNSIENCTFSLLTKSALKYLFPLDQMERNPSHQK